MQISVIIPVHNAGAYLRPCLESVRQQTYKDFEVLLVVDCPSDGSDVVCRAFAAQDRRFRLLENETNLHIGESRNKALAVAQGEYIAFVDHDDIVAPEMLASLWQHAHTTQADVVLSPVQTTLRKDSTNGVLFPEVEDKRSAALHDLLERGGSERADSLFNMILGALYKKETIGALRFVDTRYISAEDKLFQAEVLHRAARVEWVNQFLYTHVNHASNEGAKLDYVGFAHRAAAMAYLYERVSGWADAESFMPSLYVGLNKQMLSLAAAAWFRGPREFKRVRESIYQTPCFVAAIQHYHLPPPPHFLKGVYRRLLLRQLKIRTTAYRT